MAALLLAPAGAVGPAAAPAKAATTNLGGHSLSYGHGSGKVRFDLGRGKDYPRQVLVDAKGRIVVVGAAQTAAPDNKEFGTGDYETATVTRLLSSGTIDRSFGDDGTVSVHPPDDPRIPAKGMQAALTPDGGMALLYARDWDGTTYRVMRFDEDGHVVRAFGDDGTGTAPVPMPNTEPNTGPATIVMRPSGGFLIGGGYLDEPPTRAQPFVSAMTHDGGTDTAFGNNGIVRLPPDPDGQASARAAALAIGADGKILVGVGSEQGRPGRIWRLSPHGSIDVAFGVAGSVEFPTKVPGDPQGGSWGPMLTHPSGEVTVRAGARLVRFLPNGQQNSAFGDNGSIALGSPQQQVFAADGEDVVRFRQDWVQEGDFSARALAFTRILGDGSVDSDFGNRGQRILATDSVVVEGLTVDQSSGRIVGVGRDADNVAIALDNDGDRDIGFGTDGLTRFDAGSGSSDAPAAVESDGLGGLWIASSSDTPVVSHLGARGDLVASFGDEGTVALPELLHISDVVPTIDGRIVVISQPSASHPIRAVRLLNDGTRDPTFDNDRRVESGLAQYLSRVDGVALDDGRLVITSGSRAEVLMSDGSSDTTVGDAGGFATGLSGAVAIARRGQGFLMASVDKVDATHQRLIVRAWKAPGQPDNNFGTDGAYFLDGVPSSRVTNVIVEQDAITVGTTARVYRLDGDGTPLSGFTPPAFDPNTGADGWVDVAVELDGSIVVSDGVEARRFSRDGVLDPAFGDRGRITPGFGNSAEFRTSRIIPFGTEIHFVGEVHDATRVGTLEDVGVVARDPTLAGGVPRLSVGDLRVREGDFGYDFYTMDVTLDRAPDTRTLSFDVRLFSRSGTAGTDAGPATPVTYVASLGKSVPLVAPTRFAVTVSVINDTTLEPTEDLELRIVGVNYAAVANGAGTLSITNNDPRAAPYIASAQPYGTFAGGEVAAAVDVDGDGVDEVVTAPRAGGGPHVRVFRLNSLNQFEAAASFMAFDARFRGGLSIAGADIDGDGSEEIVVAPASGSPPYVAVFHVAKAGVVRRTVFPAYNARLWAGLSVASADIDGNGRDEVITAPKAGGGPHVKAFTVGKDGRAAVVAEFMAYDESFVGGVNLAGTRSPEYDRIVTAPGPGIPAQVRLFDASKPVVTMTTPFYPYGVGFVGGVNVGAADVIPSSATAVITAPMSGGPIKVFRQFGYPPDPWPAWFGFTPSEATSGGGASVTGGQFRPGAPVDLLTATGSGRAATTLIRRITY